jgi:hypothetical protein
LLLLFEEKGEKHVYEYMLKLRKSSYNMVHNKISFSEHAIMNLCIYFATSINACVDSAMAIGEIGDDYILYKFW